MNRKIAWTSILIFTLFMALFLRFSNLDWEIFEYDELPLLYSAQEYGKGNITTFIGLDQPPMMKYMNMAAVAMFGLSETSLRFFPALFGFLMVIATYFFTTRLYADRQMAILASVLVAFSIVHLIMSRYAEIPVVMGLFYLMSLYFLYDFAENRNKKSEVLLGITLALGLLSKYLMLYAVLTFVIYAIMKGLIVLRARPRASVSVDHGVIKIFLIMLAVFLAAWPIFLIPIGVEADITVDGRGQRSVDFNVPLGLLSFGDVVSSGVLAERPNGGVRYVPLLGTFAVFAVKENILFPLLFAAGMYFALKRMKKADRLVLLALFIYILFLYFQNWGYTYRHFPPVIPLIAIIASRWLPSVRDETRKILLVAAILLVVLSTALLAHPNYPSHYNFLKTPSGVDYIETHMSEGLREAYEYLESNCPSAVTDRGTLAMLGFYYQPISNESLGLPTCAVVAPAYQPGGTHDIDRILENDCELRKTTGVRGSELVKIYACEARV